VSNDGKPLDVDPGTHRLHVSRSGSRDVDQSFVIAAGERGHIVTATLDDQGKSAKSDDLGAKIRTMPIGSLIGWGVGAVGLVGFGAFGIKANIDYGNYESSCGSRCTTSARDDVAGTMVVADVFLAIGLVGAAVGTVVYLMNPPRSTATEHHAWSRR